MRRLLGLCCSLALAAGCAVTPPPAGNSNTNANSNDNVADDRLRFTATIDAAQQVDFVDSQAMGSATLVLSPDRTELSYDISADALTGAVVGVHFHDGAAGENGPIIADLSATVISNQGGSVRVMGTWEMIDPDELALLLDASLYINIHTVNFRGGEARGQIIQLVPIEME